MPYMNYNQKIWSVDMLVNYIKGNIILQNQCTCDTWIVNAKHNFNFMNVASFFIKIYLFLFYIFIFNQNIQILEIQLLINV
jgi:hypothetical protein